MGEGILKKGGEQASKARNGADRTAGKKRDGRTKCLGGRVQLLKKKMSKVGKRGPEKQNRWEKRP